MRLTVLIGLLLSSLFCHSQLNGTYTIDPGGGDYPSFNAAVTDLTTLGVSGPVVFDVASGTYTEQVSIPAITGSSAANSIIFQSQTLDSTDVVLNYPSQATVGPPNYTLNLAGASYITFRSLSITRSGSNALGHAILVSGSSTNWHFRNCQLIASNSSGNSDVLRANIVNDIGNSSIEYCYTDNGGFYLRDVINSSIEFNYNEMDVRGSYGLYLFNTSCDVTFHGNSMLIPSYSDGITGSSGGNIYGKLEFTNNEFIGAPAGSAFWLTNVHGTAADPVLIANNMIRCDGTNTFGMRLQNGEYYDILNNSIAVMTTSGVGYGIYTYTGTTNLRIHNNAILSQSACLYTGATSVTSSDNNVFWNPNGDEVYMGAFYSDIPTLFAGTGTNGNSQIADPLFIDNNNDLHLDPYSPCLGAGSTFGSIVDDFDFEARPQPVATNPDIGADEHATDGCAALAGTYVIGASVAADHATFNDAITAMLLCGISAPVIFEVEDGTYNEQVTLPEIPGNSNVNTITFRGQSLDSTLVELTYPTGTANHTVQLSGADRVTFEHMTISRTGPAGLNGVVVDWESVVADATTRSQYTVFRNCHLYTTSTLNPSTVVRGLSENNENSVTIQYCRVEGGYYGLRWSMDYSNLTLEIRDCEFLGQVQRSIQLYNAGAGDPEVYIERNDIIAPNSPGSVGVEIEHNMNLLHVIGNRIVHPAATGTAAMAIECTGFSPSWQRVMNNEIICTGNADGLRLLAGSTGIGIQYNSISTVNGDAFEIQSTTGGQLIGNALYTSGVGYALRRTGTATMATADHNLLYSTTDNLAYWNAAIATMPCLRSVTGQHANSVQADPMFVDPANDLHLQAASPCAMNGTPISGLFSDIDGESRSQPAATDPDIGADEIGTSCTPLAGSYIIGPGVGADFPNFTSAVRRMEACGISGAVIMEVENGVYNEQLVLGPVEGTNSTNTITFRSQALDSTQVLLQWPGSASSFDNYLLMFRGADHVTFEHMTLKRTNAGTFRRVVDYAPACDPSHAIVLRRNEIESTGVYSADRADLVARYTAVTIEGSMSILENRMIGGSAGVRWQGAGYQDTVLIAGNVRTGGYYGFNLQDISGPATVRDNYVSGNSSYAMGIYNANGTLLVERNEFYATSYVALELNDVVGTTTDRATIRNNFVFATGSADGIALSGAPEYIDLIYNSISTLSGTSLELVGATNGTGCRLLNNAIRNNSFRVVYRNSTFQFDQADHNVFYSPYGAPFYWSGNLGDLVAFQGATGQQANSRFDDPLFVNNSSDLHLQTTSPCLSAAIPIVGISDDFDMETRPQPVGSSPDVGADESPESCEPISGTFVIGPSVASDFPDFTSAIDRMVNCGINGPVIMEIESGTYTEQFQFPPVPGNDATNTITFRSQALDSTAVTLRYPATNSNFTNYVVQLRGVDHLTFEHFTIQRYGASSINRRSRIIEFPQLTAEASQNCTFQNMRFLGDMYASYWSYSHIIYSDNTNDELDTRILDSRFEGGGYTVYWDQDSGDDRLLVRGNDIVIEYNGLYFREFDHDLNVDRNQISGNSIATNPIAISLNNCDGGFIVQRNHIDYEERLGIYLTNCQGTAINQGNVVNNMVILTGSSSSNSGIELQGICRYVNIIHNSVSLWRGRAYEEGCSTGNNLVLLNNIFLVHDAGFGYAIYKNGPANYSFSSNNCVHTQAAGLAYWNGIRTDLAALQAGSGGFANSLECDPMFYDNYNDLHIYSMDVNAAALSWPGITEDYDGDVRSANPDIGADEFTPELWTEIHDSCEPTDPVYSDGSGKRLWIYKDRKVVASINDNGNVLGWVNGDVYINSGPIRTSLIGQYYLDRNWRINPQLPITGANVDIDLYFHQSEFALLQASDPSVSVVADVGISQYDGPNENCQVADNLAAGTWYVHYPAPNGTMPEIGLTPYRLSASLASFSEFYITTMANPLPVELISFTGRRVDRERVLLDWSTATETNNEGFEIWRRIEGENEFAQVGWVDGAGNSQTTVNYQFDDHNASSSTSYYFLRQVDHNGESESSQMLAIAGMEERIELLLWPNPASTYLQVSGLSMENAEFTITDAKGRNLASGTLSTGLLDVQELPSGLYHLLITTNGETASSRFVVER